MAWEKELPEKRIYDGGWIYFDAKGKLTQISGAGGIKLSAVIYNKADNRQRPSNGGRLLQRNTYFEYNGQKVYGQTVLPEKFFVNTYALRGTVEYVLPSEWRGKAVTFNIIDFIWTIDLDLPADGSIQLFEDGSFAPYQPYIYNGSEWEPYAPYIYNGSEWEPYS